MFSVESPHRGNSNEYAQYTIFNIKRKIALNYPKSAAMTQARVRNSVVKELSVFEPLKFYGIFVWAGLQIKAQFQNIMTPFHQLFLDGRTAPRTAAMDTFR